MLPEKKNAEKCMHSSVRCPSFYPNDLTILYHSAVVVLALVSAGLLPGLVFLLVFPLDDNDEVDDDDVLLPLDAVDEFVLVLAAGLAAAALLGPFVGSGSDALAFSNMGMTLVLEAG